ncbi:ferritin-like domain-containing protein [Aminiphilus circumscriptus]|uniref:ferritin-like domain-containing protein n=1 Tax=Aminiphilus circumscriptus TaxID=290732 RepID=UPI0004927CD0|nr:ferritin family protein [Aminiphilus circumscriptus]
MGQKVFDMKGALRYAIHAEIQASEFYGKWAENTKAGHLRSELEELTEWEDEHRKSLTAYYLRLFGEEPSIDPSLAVDPALRVQADEFKDFYSLLRIASTAYLSEMRAAELYEEMERHAEGEAKKLFTDLAAMERSHMDKALVRYNALRGEIEGPLMF